MGGGGSSLWPPGIWWLLMRYRSAASLDRRSALPGFSFYKHNKPIATGNDDTAPDPAVVLFDRSNDCCFGLTAEAEFCLVCAGNNETPSVVFFF